MARGPQLVLGLGAGLALLMVAALWFTSEPAPVEEYSAVSPAQLAPETEAPALPARPTTAAPPPPSEGAAPAPALRDAGRPLIPGRDYPLPRDLWPERLQPQHRQVVTPPLEDAPAVRREDLRAAIESVTPLIKQCFLDAAEKNAGDQRVVLKFTIVGQGTSGFFQDGEVAESSIPDPWVQACFLEALTDARFPAPSGGGTVTVTYPFAFTDTRDAGSD